ncbi:MAG TPA: hypothetical protein PKM73_13390 [Verrucomicrobiota bacterium]|nr:hypothetical protein [Verrucomicrobiota bacterium]HNU52206.1 hypothetical protein [Verrucomicrobiota bacterium]
MSRIVSPLGALGFAGAAAMAVLVWQGMQIRRLEDRARAVEPVPASRPAPSALAPPASAPAPLSEAERLELLRLRAEITRLRARHGELAGADAENAALRARAAGGSSNAAAARWPVDFVPRARVPLAGYDTPHAAFQSLLWAIEHRDTNVLARALGEGHFQHLMAIAEREGAESFWQMAAMIPGYHYLGQTMLDDETATLTVEVLPGDPTEITVHRVGGDWRVDMR